MTVTRLSKNILFTVTMLFWLSLYAYIPYVTPELQLMGATATFIGFATAAYGFIQLFIRIPIGISSDKWQKKFFICFGCLCAGLASLVMLFFYTPAAFVVGRALGGLAGATWVSFTVLYSSYFKPEQTTRAITLLNAGNEIGKLVAFILAGVFVARYGPKAAFAISAIGGLIGFILSLFITEDRSKKGKPLTVRELFAVAKNRHLIIVSILALLVQVLAFSSIFSFTANYAHSIGATPAELSYMNIALLAPSILLGLFLSKVILKHIDARPLIAVGFFLSAAYLIVLPHITTIIMLYVIQCVAGLGFVLTYGIMTGYCLRDIVVQKRGAAMGFFQAAYSIGMTVGPLVMGLLVDFTNLRTGFLSMGGLAISAATLTIVLLCSKATNKAP